MALASSKVPLNSRSAGALKRSAKPLDELVAPEAGALALTSSSDLHVTMQYADSGKMACLLMHELPCLDLDFAGKVC